MPTLSESRAAPSADHAGVQVDECSQLDLLTDAPLKAPAAAIQLPWGPCQLSLQALSAGQYSLAILSGQEQLPISQDTAGGLQVVAQAGPVDPEGTFMLPVHLPTTVAAGGVFSCSMSHRMGFRACKQQHRQSMPGSSAQRCGQLGLWCLL